MYLTWDFTLYTQLRKGGSLKDISQLVIGMCLSQQALMSGSLEMVIRIKTSAVPSEQHGKETDQGHALRGLTWLRYRSTCETEPPWRCLIAFFIEFTVIVCVGTAGHSKFK